MDHFNRFDLMQVWALLGSALLMLILLPVGKNIDHLLSLPWIDQTGYYLKNNEFLVNIRHIFLKKYCDCFGICSSIDVDLFRIYMISVSFKNDCSNGGDRNADIGIYHRNFKDKFCACLLLVNG